MNANNIGFEEISKKNTQDRFSWAVTYIAQGENGTGLSPAKFETAMEWAREWKHNLVKFLIDKPIKGGTGNHTKVTATETADAIFKFRYEQEVRAWASPTMSTYGTREVSGIEYGELEVDKLGRLQAEDQDIYKLPRAWTSTKQMKINYGQLLSYLAQGKSPGKVLRNARNMMIQFMISKEQYKSLVKSAGGIVVAAAKHQQTQTEIAL